MYSRQGLGEMSRQFHTAIRRHLLRRPWADPQTPRPVLINSWEACYFTFDEQRLLQLARAAKQADIDLFVLHQANERIIDRVVKSLHRPPEKCPKNIAKYGNTSAASIPLALDELQRAGGLRKGMRVLLVGFGGGLTWAGALLRW